MVIQPGRKKHTVIHDGKAHEQSEKVWGLLVHSCVFIYLREEEVEEAFVGEDVQGVSRARIDDR